MQNTKETIKALCAKSVVRWLAGAAGVVLCGVGLIYYWRVAYSFSSLSAPLATALVCGGFLLLYLLVFLTAHYVQQDFAAKAAILIFAAGLAFVFVNPPLQAPDETMHFLRAYSIAGGNFSFDQNEDFPTDVDLLVRDFPGNYNLELPLTDKTSIADAFVRYRNDLANEAVDAPGATTPVQQCLPYLPQAAGMAVGRIIGANALTCMYLGRSSNLLCYALLCYVALRAATRFRSALTALMLVPIGLFMAASTSSDGLLLGLMWLFIGLCLSDRMTRGRSVALAVSFGILFTAKYNFLALLPLLWLLPVHKPALGEKKQRISPRLGLLLLCLFGAVFLFGAQTLHTALGSNYGTLTYFDPAIRPAAQLRFLFAHPARYAAVFLYSLYLNKAELFSMGVFGWRDLIVPLVSYFTPLVLLLAASFDAQDAARETPKTGWLFALSGALLLAFTYTGMYLTSTPYQMVQITGVQSRYLLSAFFALLVLAARLIGRTLELQRQTRDTVQKTHPAWRMLHISFLFAIVSVLLLFQTYYIGA